MARVSWLLRRFCSLLQNSRIQISIIITIGLVQGLVFVFLMPPWQHYDEPGHFEYAKLVALWGTVPRAGDYDPVLAKEIYSSMVRWNFFSPEKAVAPADPNTDGAVYRAWINQVGDPPLYYIVAAIFLRLFASQSIEFQLYSGRLISLLFFLITIWTSYRFTTEFTDSRSMMRWMVPATIALLPGVVDLMTAFSNDPAAVMFFSLFLWISIKMILKGIKPGLLFLVLLLALACLLAKRTMLMVPLVLPFVLIFSAFRKKLEKIGWVVALLSIVAVLLASFDLADAALWYRDALQLTPTRVRVGGPSGKDFAFQLKLNTQEYPPGLYQILPLNESNHLPGKIVTLGSWMWANTETTVQAAGIRIINKDSNVELLPGPTVTLGTKPVFYAATFSIPENAMRIYVALNPYSISSQDTSVYYMTPVLVEGERPIEVEPTFTNKQKTEGLWNGSFVNLVRNPDASQPWPTLKSPVLTQANRVAPQLVRTFNWTIDLLDWQGNRWYFVYSLRSIFRTFWGKFAWGSVPLLGRYTYRLLEFFTILIMFGVGISLVIRWKQLPWTVIIFCSICMLSTIGVALYVSTGVGTLIIKGSIPVARFIIPMIIPIAFCINGGWLSLFDLIKRGLKIGYNWPIPLVFFSLLVWLDIIAYISITRFYKL